MIGVFDSGVGGLSVLTEIRRALPEADLLYVADRARAPYGTRSLEEVRHMAHGVSGWLIDRGATTIVVACNTASAAALDSLRGQFGAIAFVGMEPAVKPATAATKTGVIGVLATAATFQGRLFESVVRDHAATVEVVTTACPKWVQLVETGTLDGADVELIVSQGVQPALTRGADTLVLGCTHFPFLTPVIRRMSGPDVTIIDPAAAVAAQTARVAAKPEGDGVSLLAASGDLDEFATLASTIAGVTSDQPLLPFPA